MSGGPRCAACHARIRGGAHGASTVRRPGRRRYTLQALQTHTTSAGWIRGSGGQRVLGPGLDYDVRAAAARYATGSRKRSLPAVVQGEVRLRAEDPERLRPRRILSASWRPARLWHAIPG